jgi:hypothetical protein
MCEYYYTATLVVVWCVLQYHRSVHVNTFIGIHAIVYVCMYVCQCIYLVAHACSIYSKVII